MMDSLSSRLEKAILSIFDDNSELSISMIKNELEKKGFRYNVDYKEPNFSGVIYKLKSSGQIVSVKRGVYSTSHSYSKNQSSSDSDRSEQKTNENSKDFSEDSYKDSLDTSFLNAYSKLNLILNNINYELDQRSLNSISSELQWERIRAYLSFREDLSSLIDKYHRMFDGNPTMQDQEE